MKYIIAAIFFASFAAAQLPPTDKPLGTVIEGNDPTTFTLGRDYMYIPMSEAVETVQLTTDTLSTRTVSKILFLDDGTTQTTQVIQTRRTTSRWPGHFVKRLRTSIVRRFDNGTTRVVPMDYFRNPLNGRYFRRMTQEEREARGIP